MTRVDPNFIRAHYAGVVESKKRRYTGTVVTIYKAKEAGLDPEGGKWVGCCEEHGQVCMFETLRQARRHAPLADWCSVCSADDEPDGNFDDFDKLYY